MSHTHMTISKEGYCPCGCGSDLKRPDYAVEERGHTTPCWIWQKSKTRDGYGYLGRGGKIVRAHRHYWEAVSGRKLRAGEEVDHECNIRDCVNPAHLDAVTRTENIRRSSRTKLTMEQATEIRERHGAGAGLNALAAAFDVHKSTINRIVRGVYWA